MQILNVCLIFLRIGFLSFGGGMSVLSLIAELVVKDRGWMEATALTDLVTLSEMTPDPIAVNAATFTGMQIGGVVGAVLATLCCVIPGGILSLILVQLYQKHHTLPAVQRILCWLRSAVTAVIAYGGLTILKTAVFPDGHLELVSLCGFILALVLFLWGKKKTIPVLLLVGIVCTVVQLVVR